jgi:hypothetical protein
MPLNTQHECGVAVVDEMVVYPCKSGERRRRTYAECREQANIIIFSDSFRNLIFNANEPFCMPLNT